MRGVAQIFSGLRSSGKRGGTGSHIRARLGPGHDWHGFEQNSAGSEVPETRERARFDGLPPPRSAVFGTPASGSEFFVAAKPITIQSELRLPSCFSTGLCWSKISRLHGMVRGKRVDKSALS